MALNWTRIGRILFVLSIALLIVPSGVALAGGDDHGAHTETDSHSGQNQHGHEPGGFLSTWYAAIGGLFLLGSVATLPAYRRIETTKTDALTPVHLATALLAVFSSAVHLYLFFEHGTLVMLLAGLGFLGGIALFFAGVNRRALYLGGAAFAAVQIPLWVAEGMPHLQSYGILDKVAQVALVCVLGYLYITERD